ncbi:MAG: hypothetical protein PVJ78_05195 [Gammaproteobacteria bacterium]|jgi:hypothetical protein
MAQPIFEIGELVITQHATYFSELDGSLGIITKPLQRKLCTDLHLMEKVYGHVYGVRLLVKGEPQLYLRPWQLRKLGYDDQIEFKSVARKSKQNSKSKLAAIES